MALKLNLKPHEKCIIGGAAIQNGSKMASLMIANQTTVLREKHIMTEEKADTIAKQIYFVVQLIYLDGGIDNSKQNHEIFFKLIREFIDLEPSSTVLEMIAKIGQYLLDGIDYKALAECRKLVEYEAKMLNRQLDASNQRDVSLQKETNTEVKAFTQLEVRN
jgi:flagellar protein FlbT